MTMAEKLNCKERELVVRRGKKEKVIRDSHLVEAIQNCRRLTSQLKEIEPLLRDCKSIIFDYARSLLDEGGTLTFHVAGISCKVTLRYEALIPEDNVPELKSLLGSRFKDLVRVQTRYVCSQALADYAEQKGITRLIELKELTPQLRWQETL